MTFGELPLEGAKHREADVVINGRFLAKPNSGVSRVGVELLQALSEELPLRVPGLSLRVATPSGVATLPASATLRQRTRGFAGQIGEQLGLPLLYPDATVMSFCNVTPMLARRSVVWIHDTHVFDTPESYTFSYRWWHRTMLAAYKRRGFSVVTVSSFAKERLIAHGFEPSRIQVIHNGGDHILKDSEDVSVLQRAGLEQQQYLLVVGSPARHKNLPFALRTLLTRKDESKIAVVGLSQAGPYLTGEGISDDPRLVRLPRVSDSELRALYKHASAVICPSLCEGFGLYAAEAMFADSGPLLLSNRGALPEVGGNAALYFEPTDTDALLRVVEQAKQPDTREQLREAALQQRANFTWRRAARSVIAAYLS